MNLTRFLAVLAAANLVAAFAMATLLPPLTALAQLIAMADADWLIGAHDFVVRETSPWIWLHVLMPLLVRPCWLVPTSLGIVFAGGATTLASRKGMPRSHRRRS